jgi:hypothetical protein
MLCGTIGSILVPELVSVDPGRALVILIFSYVMQGESRVIWLYKVSGVSMKLVRREGGEGPC